MKHIVCYSGGHSSALVAVEVARRYGIEDLILVNHDVALEDDDVKRFKKEVAEYIGVSITYANMKDAQTKNQFKVVVDAQAFKVGVGNVICTSRMKTEPFYTYLENEHPDKDCVIYYGFDSTPHELMRVQRRSSILGAQGYKTDFPLALWKDRTINDTKEIGIEPPLLYSTFKHANCIGCLKAGRQHWYVVYCNYPVVWEEAKWAEDEIGYTIIKNTSLADLEPMFKKMKEAGVPATEHIQPAKFWASAKKSIMELPVIQNEAEMPCECSV